MMPEPKGTTGAAAPAKAAEQGEAQTATEELVEGLEAEILDEAGAEGEETATAEAGSEAPTEESSEEPADDDLAEFAQADPKKDNVQRRIDQLIAENKAMKADLEKLQQKEGTEKKTPKYTDDQLAAALKKGIEEGDTNLVFDVFRYMNQQMKENLIEMYNGEKTQAQAVHNDWRKVCDDYSKVWEGEKGKELYPGAQSELDLTSSSSLLYRLALQYYYSKDEDGKPRYAGVAGGQRMAVADALAAILRKRGSVAGKRTLQNALNKERRKRSSPGSNALDVEKTGRAQSSKNALDEYVEERKKFKAERS